MERSGFRRVNDPNV